MKECQLCKTCFADDVASCPHDGMPTVHTISGEPVLEGKYHIESRLGQGGMGVVYKARHAYLKTTLAIKVILPDLVGNDPQLVTRFRQEALAAAAIRHQNVVAVTDYGVIDGTVPFLVMEYVEGESLHDMLGREKALAPERAFELMAAVCAGVGAAHHQGIVHRDLKPLNIMVCSDKPNLTNAVKILDFGLAKIKSGELLGSFIQAQTTGLMGSPYYMAPEQWADEEPDSRADVYSLGVMMFQVLAGDVPFKGSSIPAIMKKHISDPLPTFASAGVTIAPELERAVLHTLQKDREKRTASVEVFVDELREALYPGLQQFIHSGAQRSLSGTARPVAVPTSSLKVTTKPPRSNIFVDNVAYGQSKDDGALLLEGIQSGNHHVRVTHDGFYDWQSEVVCDGKPQEITAELSEGVTGTNMAIPQPSISSLEPIGSSTMPNRSNVDNEDPMAKTVQQAWQDGATGVSVTSQTPAKSGLSPVLLGMIGLFALLLVGGIGIGGAWKLGMFGSGSKDNPPANANSTASPPPQVSYKPVMIPIPGGTFMMGRNDGPQIEGPAHSMPVKSFSMDKTEVTNGEYYQFVSQKGYQSIPDHWINNQPIKGQENMPVRYVNMADINAFIAWRLQRDGVKYRLPTEEEWEYAARNGVKDNLYPWGNTIRKECAVLDKTSNEAEIVGSKSCPNDWGVVDLIGNVLEWTSSNAAPYPGSGGTAVKKATEPEYMVRGGCMKNSLTGDGAVTSTSRLNVIGSKRDLQLGFRLVADN
jgi:eukaryotic-like serine/threonine-protein kinase